MKIYLWLIAFAVFAGNTAPPAGASQESDAQALVDMFAEEETFDPGLRYELRIDGCSAKFDNGWNYFRLLLSSIDFAAWADDDRHNSIPLNSDAVRQAAEWIEWRGPIPRSPLGWIFDESAPKEQQRKAKYLFEKGNLDYFEQLLRGEYGPWYAEHHSYKVENGVPLGFKPRPAAWVQVRPERKQLVIDAVRRYTEKYCLPAPDFSCTPFFVDAPGTVC